MGGRYPTTRRRPPRANLAQPATHATTCCCSFLVSEELGQLSVIRVPIAPFSPPKGSSLNAPLAEDFAALQIDEVHARVSSGTLPSFAGLGFAGWRPTGEPPMDEYTKTEIWDLAAGTFIAVSVVSGMAFIIASAIH